jgi:hypothetical protein
MMNGSIKKNKIYTDRYDEESNFNDNEDGYESNFKSKHKQ